MEIKDGRITFLVGTDKTTIEIHDRSAGVMFVRIELTPEQLSSALSRLAWTPCEKMEVFGLDKLGKTREVNVLVFEVPEGSEWNKRKEIAIKEAERVCPEGWTVDKYFGSKDSFFTKDGKPYAQTFIRRWV